MNNDYIILKVIREYPDITDYKILEAIREYPGITTDRYIAKNRKSVRHLRPKFKPYTYFIQDQQGRVKIGTSVNVQTRLSAIQTCNADKLTLLTVLDEDEGDLHKKFDKYRIRGEWFTLSDEIREYLK